MVSLSVSLPIPDITTSTTIGPVAALFTSMTTPLPPTTSDTSVPIALVSISTASLCQSVPIIISSLLISEANIAHILVTDASKPKDPISDV
jgi:hypothetical protein